MKNLTSSNGTIINMYAIWSANKYNLIVTSQNTSFGTVSESSGQVSFGSSVTVTATPKTNYKFLGWSDGSNIISIDPIYTFTMPNSDYSLSGIFTIANANNGEVVPYNQNITFVVIKDKMTWFDAEKYAQSLGGHLAKVDTAEKNEYLADRISSIGNSWIGLTDAEQEGTWKWVVDNSIAGYVTEEDNGDYTEYVHSGWSYMNWNGGEPNNLGNEDYVEMYLGGKWNDLNGEGLYPFIVEIRNNQ